MSNRGWYVNSLLIILRQFLSFTYNDYYKQKHWIDVSHDYQRVVKIGNELNYLLKI